jgi:hypothetical protein
MAFLSLKNGGQYRTRTCDILRIKPVLFLGFSAVVVAEIEAMAELGGFEPAVKGFRAPFHVVNG